jgi:hypothetical protein
MYNINNFPKSEINPHLVMSDDIAPLNRFVLSFEVKTEDGWHDIGSCIIHRVLSKWLCKNKPFLPKEYKMMDVLHNHENLLFIAFELGCKESPSSRPHERLLESDLYVVSNIEGNNLFAGGKEYVVKNLKRVIEQKFGVKNPFIVTLPDEYRCHDDDDKYFIPDPSDVSWLQENGFEFIEPNGVATMYLKYIVLRDNMVVDELNISDSDITNLPKGLVVNGALLMENTDIEELPDDIKFHSLFAAGSKLKKLPDGLTVDGWLDISETPMSKLPENLTVMGSFDMSYTDIEELPVSAKFGGSITAAGSKLAKLPDGLTVNGPLDISETPMKTLPENLTVNGTLTISETDITVIPDSTKVNGGLTAHKSKLERLPENFEVTILTLDGSPMTELPKSLKAKLLSVRNEGLVRVSYHPAAW